jgi:hypothetical protein
MFVRPDTLSSISLVPSDRVIMNRRDNQRAPELNVLKLEVASFALRLDAFEARMRGPADQDKRRTVEAGLVGYRSCEAGTEPMKISPCLID